MGERNVEVEYKITIVALIYALFKIMGDYLGIVPGSSWHVHLLIVCRVVFVLWHIWFFVEYKRARDRINNTTSLSALIKLQQRKSIKYTLRWIYFRALVIGATHIYYPESLPLLIGTPILAVMLTKENPEWK